MTFKTTLLTSGFVTHDTRRFVLSRPQDLTWEPGQGMELAIDTPHWRDEGRPFTPTGLVEDQALEFIIKAYPTDGVTQALHDLQPGASLVLGEPFGTIAFRSTGTFIAAGTGITPFLGILRRLAADGDLEGNSLLVSNKSESDLICGAELKHYLGEHCVFTFTREHDLARNGHRIDAAFLKGHVGDFDQFFYVCGPDEFVESVNDALVTLGAHPDRLVYEH